MIGSMMAIFRKSLNSPKKGFYRENQRQLQKRLLETNRIPKQSLVILRGPEEMPVYDDDQTYPLEPENLLLYLFGISEKNCLVCLNLANSESSVFIKLPTE